MGAFRFGSTRFGLKGAVGLSGSMPYDDPVAVNSSAACGMLSPLASWK
jgi:hypothetical protein